MARDEILDEFLKRNNIELFPFQREMIKKMMDESKIYICYPPRLARTNILWLKKILEPIFEKGENNGSVS